MSASSEFEMLPDIDRMKDTAPAGALGGSYNEIGSEYRAYVGALLASCVLRRESLAAIQLAAGQGKAISIEAEGDRPVDDLVVETDEGHRIYFQAKKSAGLTRGDSPFAKTLVQFARALESDIGDGDRLVLACGSATKPLRALGRLLDRRELDFQASPDPIEAKALTDFGEIVAAVIPDLVPGHLLDRMLIWETNPSEGDARMALESRLESKVAAAGAGGQAARELADTVRKLARLRGGLGALGLIGELARREVPLSPKAPPASPVRQGAALSRHRERIRRAGATLRLLGVTGHLADIPFAAADAEIAVKVNGDDDSLSGREPVLALRRRGRALLIARPGGGKSTALRSLAAHWATRPDWPAPISVHLQRLAGGDSGFTAGLLDAATDELAGGERTALRGALEHELARGRCLLLLDGLDEVRRGRKIFATELSAWLKELHPDVEVLIASRPVALADAATLDLPSLFMKEPEAPERTADAILRAAAEEEIAEDHREVWVAERREWLTKVFDRNQELSATPLMVVLLALAAVSSRKVGELPTRRAEVLRQSIEDALGEWEVEARRRGEVAIGSLTGARAAEALRWTFCLLGENAISESPPDQQEVGVALSAVLAAHFELAPGNARAAASEALAFWEEAGLFTFEGDGLMANVRSLAELGSAWLAAEASPDRQRRWVSHVRSEDDLWQCLALAAGLSDRIAELWAQALASGGQAAELSALLGARRDGVYFTASSLKAVAVGLAADGLTDEAEAEDMAWALIDLPLDNLTRESLRPLLSQAVPEPRKGIIETRVTVRWDERGTEAHGRLRDFVSAPKPPPPAPRKVGKDDEDGSFHIFLRLPGDSHFHDAFQEAALRLAAGLRSDAELVISKLDEADIEFPRRLRAALREGGNDDLRIPERPTSAFRGFGWEPGDFDAAEEAMLAWASEVASPQPLTWAQRRRLDEIVDLWETFRANWISPRWPLERPELARRWIEAAIVLGGFDASVLAAEARQILGELGDGEDLTSMLFDDGNARSLDHWEAVEDRAATVGQLISTIGRCSREVTVAIASALESAPAELDAAGLLAVRIERLRAWSCWFTAITLLRIASDPESLAREWQSSTIRSCDRRQRCGGWPAWQSMGLAKERCCTL